MSSSIDKAREAGYSDEDILSHLEKSKPHYSSPIQSAREIGYSPSEILSHLAKSSTKRIPKEPSTSSKIAQNVTESLETPARAAAQFGLGAAQAQALPYDIAAMGVQGLQAIPGVKEGQFRLQAAEEIEQLMLQKQAGDWSPEDEERLLQFQSVLAGGPEVAREIGQLENVDLTSEGILNSIQEATGARIAPEGFLESTARTAGLITKGLPGIIKSLGSALISESSGEAAKTFGAGEGAQSAIRAGSLILASALDRKGTKKIIDRLYSERDATITPQSRMVAGNLRNDLQSLKANLEKGITTSEKTPVLKAVDEILKKIGSNGTMSVEELVQAKHDLNAIRGDPAFLKGAEKMLNRAVSSVDRSLESYGKQNPRFGELNKAANEAFAADAASRKSREFLRKTLKVPGFQKGTDPKTAALIGSAVAFLTGHPVAGAIGVTGAAALPAAEFVTKVARSPTLQREYSKLLGSAIRQDAAAVEKDFESFIRALQEEER